MDKFLPSHVGYEYLIESLEARDELEVARALCKQAQRQGWHGDWVLECDRPPKPPKARAKRAKVTKAP